MSTSRRRKPYMPDSDAGKVEWMSCFLGQIETDPPRYGFDDAKEFEHVQQTIRAFLDAMRTVQNKKTHTPGAVREKNDARSKAVAICREIAMRLKMDPTLSVAEKIALGIRTATARPQRAKLPQGLHASTSGYPLLVVQNSPHGGHVIRYSDPVTEATSKPKGVSHMLLFAAIGEQPRMRCTHARLLGAYTKRPFEIRWPMCCGIEGLYVTYYGRWLTTRGEMGPWSRGVSRIIGETRVPLQASPFAHMFEQSGFIDALPQGRAEAAVVDRPQLEGGQRAYGGFWEVLESKMLPLQSFAMLESDLGDG